MILWIFISLADLQVGVVGLSLKFLVYRDWNIMSIE